MVASVVGTRLGANESHIIFVLVLNRENQLKRLRSYISTGRSRRTRIIIQLTPKRQEEVSEIGVKLKRYLDVKRYDSDCFLMVHLRRVTPNARSGSGSLALDSSVGTRGQPFLAPEQGRRTKGGALSSCQGQRSAQRLGVYVVRILHHTKKTSQSREQGHWPTSVSATLTCSPCVR